MCNNCPQQTVFRSWNELTEHRAQAHPDLVWKAKRSRVFSCYLCAHKCRTKPGYVNIDNIGPHAILTEMLAAHGILVCGSVSRAICAEISENEYTLIWYVYNLN